MVGWADGWKNNVEIWTRALFPILDFHTKFHPNWTNIGKVGILRRVRRVWDRVVGVVRSKK